MITDWNFAVATTIDALHAMTPDERTIVRIWLAKQDALAKNDPTGELLDLAKECAKDGVAAVAYRIGVKLPTLYRRLSVAGYRMRKMRATR